MTRNDRPLSPDLQICRPQLTSVLSITHRLTGIALSVGSPLLVAWLIVAAAVPSAYATLHGFLASWLGPLLLLGWTFSLFFHRCNGIRHLFWDAGYGFDLQTIYVSGWAVVAISIGLTLAAWIINIEMKG
jgi:succinate dehydrogenase / fumarate reductase, cytochrome b subunit